MTSTSQHNPDASDRPLNQNDRMSEDSGDGGATAAEAKPGRDRQDESAIEAFGREGAGIAAKE